MPSNGDAASLSSYSAVSGTVRRVADVTSGHISGLADEVRVLEVTDSGGETIYLGSFVGDYLAGGFYNFHWSNTVPWRDNNTLKDKLPHVYHPLEYSTIYLNNGYIIQPSIYISGVTVAMGNYNLLYSAPLNEAVTVDISVFAAGKSKTIAAADLQNRFATYFTTGTFTVGYNSTNTGTKNFYWYQFSGLTRASGTGHVGAGVQYSDITGATTFCIPGILDFSFNAYRKSGSNYFPRMNVEVQGTAITPSIYYSSNNFEGGADETIPQGENVEEVTSFEYGSSADIIDADSYCDIVFESLYDRTSDLFPYDTMLNVTPQWGTKYQQPDNGFAQSHYLWAFEDIDVNSTVELPVPINSGSDQNVLDSGGTNPSNLHNAKYVRTMTSASDNTVNIFKENSSGTENMVHVYSSPLLQVGLMDNPTMVRTLSIRYKSKNILYVFVQNEEGLVKQFLLPGEPSSIGKTMTETRVVGMRAKYIKVQATTSRIGTNPEFELHQIELAVA